MKMTQQKKTHLSLAINCRWWLPESTLTASMYYFLPAEDIPWHLNRNFPLFHDWTSVSRRSHKTYCYWQKHHGTINRPVRERHIKPVQRPAPMFNPSGDRCHIDDDDVAQFKRNKQPRSPFWFLGWGRRLYRNYSVPWSLGWYQLETKVISHCTGVATGHQQLVSPQLTWFVIGTPWCLREKRQTDEWRCKSH